MIKTFTRYLIRPCVSRPFEVSFSNCCLNLFFVFFFSDRIFLIRLLGLNKGFFFKIVTRERLYSIPVVTNRTKMYLIYSFNKQYIFVSEFSKLMNRHYYMAFNSEQHNISVVIHSDLLQVYVVTLSNLLEFWIETFIQSTEVDCSNSTFQA